MAIIGLPIEPSPILIPDNPDDVLPPGYVPDGILPGITNPDGSIITDENDLAVTGECVDNTDPCTEYWCLDDGVPPGYWDPEDGCPPGCQEVPEYSNTIPGIEFCTVRENLAGDLVHSDGKYVVYWSAWSCSLFLEDGTERGYSRIPPNDPQNGAGYWLFDSCIIVDDKLIIIVSQQNNDDNLYYVEYDIINNVPLREGFFYGTSVGGTNRLTSYHLRFPNVVGGIIAIGGPIIIRGSSNRYIYNGLLVINPVDFSYNVYGSQASLNSNQVGAVWEANTFNFLSTLADPFTDGKYDLYYTEGDGGTTVTEIIFPDHPTTDMLGVFDLKNGTAAVTFTDRVIICSSNGTFIKEITEGYSLTALFDDYDIRRQVHTYQDKFVIACNPTGYKGSTGVGVADVYHVDTLEYLYTLNIPAVSVSNSSYYDIVVETDYATYRRRSNDNNNSTRDLLICVKTQEA